MRDIHSKSTAASHVRNCLWLDMCQAFWASNAGLMHIHTAQRSYSEHHSMLLIFNRAAFEELIGGRITNMPQDSSVNRIDPFVWGWRGTRSDTRMGLGRDLASQGSTPLVRKPLSIHSASSLQPSAGLSRRYTSHAIHRQIGFSGSIGYFVQGMSAT